MATDRCGPVTTATRIRPLLEPHQPLVTIGRSVGRIGGDGSRFVPVRREDGRSRGSSGRSDACERQERERRGPAHLARASASGGHLAGASGSVISQERPPLRRAPDRLCIDAHGGAGHAHPALVAGHRRQPIRVRHICRSRAVVTGDVRPPRLDFVWPGISSPGLTDLSSELDPGLPGVESRPGADRWARPRSLGRGRDRWPTRIAGASLNRRHARDATCR